MRAWVKRAAFVAAALVLLALWGLSWQSAQQLAAFQSLATMQLKAPLAPDAYSRMRRTEERTPAPADFTLWRQTDNETLENPALGRSTTANVIALRGDSRLVLPAAPFLAAEDFGGCVLDEKTAYGLFGDRNAAGESLVYGGKTYLVRGVFASPKATVLVQQQKGEFSKITLRTGGVQTAADEFAMRQGISLLFTSQGGVYYGWAAAFAQLPAWVFGAVLLFFLLRAAHRRREYPVQGALLVLAAVAVTACYVWAAGLQAAFPQGLVPSRWSDFEFWQRTWAQLGGQAFELFRSKKDQPDIAALGFAAKSIAAGLSAAALMAGIGRKMLFKRQKAPSDG